MEAITEPTPDVHDGFRPKVENCLVDNLTIGINGQDAAIQFDASILKHVVPWLYNIGFFTGSIPNSLVYQIRIKVSFVVIF